jgi:hypothetical protein
LFLPMMAYLKTQLVQLDEHTIEDELIFPSHDGYIFHDSRGFEAGDDAELKIVQDFVRRRSQERRLRDRVHAIWFVSLGVYDYKFKKGLLFRYCISMDNVRPWLEFKHFGDIGADKNSTSGPNFTNAIDLTSLASPCNSGIYEI